MRNYVLNEAMRECHMCGKDCSGQEMEASISKTITCLGCQAQIREWESSIQTQC